MCVCVRGNEVNRTEFMRKKVNGGETYYLFLFFQPMSFVTKFDCTQKNSIKIK